MYSGPHIKKDGLVFGYDTGQFSESNPNFDKFKPHKNEGRGTGRFFKGKPITNFIAYQNAVAQSSYTSYSATSSGTWNAKHPNAIRAYNAQGSQITGYVNTGVGDWTNTYHAHWQFDKTLKKPVVVMDCFDSNWKAKSFDCNTSAWSTYGMTTGSKYVISWLQWTTNTSKALSVGVYAKNTSGTRNFYDGRSNSSDTTVLNTKRRKWQRVYKVYTVSSAHDVTQDYQRIYMYGHANGPNSNGVTVKIADVQLELNTDHPSSFLNSISSDSKTSRSSTESILDLAKTTNIDVSNVSFDSNGLPTFDGTDDRIVSGTAINLSSYTSLTYEGIVKAVGLASYDRWFSATNAGNTGFHNPDLAIGTDGQLRYIFSSGGIGSWVAPSGLTIDTTKFNHLVYTFTNSGVVKIYINGTQQHTATYSSATFPSNSKFMTGMRFDNNGEGVSGSIPIVKVYSRALSPQEVKQNFRAYKNRFNI